ncbi:MAG: hypothetical protein WA709_05635 [Stellaceae bacterium]
MAQNLLDWANLAYQEAVRGFIADEHEIAEANVGKGLCITLFEKTPFLGS